MVRAGGYCLVEYPDIAGDASGMFEMSVSRDIQVWYPIWHGILISAQEDLATDNGKLQPYAERKKFPRK